MSKLPTANSIDEINKPANILTTQRAVIISLFVTVGFSCLLLYHSAHPFEFLPSYEYLISPLMKSQQASPFDSKLETVLAKAAMKDKTVIITTMNHAWAEPNSIFDIFLKSFRTGNGTRKFLDNLVVVSLDEKAHARCKLIHTHCYVLNTSGFDFSGTEAYFMTSNYLEMMWIRIRLLSTILQMGYNFVFTLPPSEKAEKKNSWRVPKNCSLKAFHPPPSPPPAPKINGSEGNNQ
ncbi:hypothetical protein Patl1_14187 [Pistacia atlantica]|uniref:Uncharacterized protein n=1 Tax=Pistacia atlantica TaxID=434234 RepID=A0ACC1AY77_9ROSI|nr:hypothetical protein Patl1_14187 [Pistacia atlantica]